MPLMIERQTKMSTFRNNAFLLLVLGNSLVWNITEAATTPPKKQQVCVLGAGPAGLASVKEAAAYPDECNVVAFEKNSDIGGQWFYSDSSDEDNNTLKPVQSSVYKNLRTNFPKEIMVYPDYQNFNGENRSSVSHAAVLDYLRNYTAHFNLRPYIQFNTLVEKVSPTISYGDWIFKWLVETRNLNTNQISKTTCDSVMVCNGHYTVPKIPKIPGIETFTGKVIHSKVYRQPEDYAGQTVVVLGAGISGVDISLEISNHAKKVYLSHNHDKITNRLPSNMVQVSGVASANGKTLKLRDGSSITADAFIFCTGFKYTYPFLDETSGVHVERNHVAPLYKHIVNIVHPSMSFIGLPSITTYPMFYTQTKYYISLLRGKTQLPSKKEMLADSKVHEFDFSSDLPHTRYKQWAYFDELARLGDFEPIPAFYRRGLAIWSEHKAHHLLDFKEMDMRVLDYGEVVLVPHHNY